MAQAMAQCLSALTAKHVRQQTAQASRMEKSPVNTLLRAARNHVPQLKKSGVNTAASPHL